nr:PQQ-dependent sugar dehydrogenase [uncultured Methanoregula sp.]
MGSSVTAGILLSFAIIAVITAGCTTGPAQGSSGPTSLSPAGSSPVPSGVTGQSSVNQADLTNQNSPLAAAFKDGHSLTPFATPQPVIGLQKIVTGLSAPMMIAVPGDGSGRMVVVDQIGVARIITANNTLSNEPFLDVRDRMVGLSSGYDERGLLSIAFHPDYKNNGRLFVYYSAPLRPGAPAGWSHTNRLSEFHIMPDNKTRVNMSSEKILLEVDKPESNHNGGPLLFGPDDGYLYLALGDGGGADDTGTGHTPGTGNAQDMTTFLGKILRIDVDHPADNGRMYAIPRDNPFVNTAGVLPEIYASGFRNPAYLSVDSGTNHHMVTAVAGQALFESVDIVTKGGNYGWHIREGTHCFDPAHDATPLAGPCAITGSRNDSLIGPIVELGHDAGSVVVGGYIYRGTAFPGSSGKYIFGDWSSSFNAPGSGSIFIATPPSGYDISMYPDTAANVTPADNRMWTTQKYRIATTPSGEVGAFVRGFGEGPDHELYVLTSQVTGPDPAGTTGTIWKLVPA